MKGFNGKNILIAKSVMLTINERKPDICFTEFRYINEIILLFLIKHMVFRSISCKKQIVYSVKEKPDCFIDLKHHQSKRIILDR